MTFWLIRLTNDLRTNDGNNAMNAPASPEVVQIISPTKFEAHFGYTHRIEWPAGDKTFFRSKAAATRALKISQRG